MSGAKTVSMKISYCLQAALFGLGFLVASGVPCCAQELAQYSVTLDPQNLRLVRLEADLPIHDDMLQMHPRGATHLADGWATFVRNLRAISDTGAAISLQPLGKGRWQVPAPLPKRLKLTYEIAIEHDQGQWPFGHDEAAYAKVDCAFLLGRAIFIAAPTYKNLRVRFVLPKGWRVSTPWPEVAGEAGVYAVCDVEELTDAGLLAGKHLERRITVGGFEVVLAVGSELGQAAGLFEEVIRGTAQEATLLFGGTPIIKGAKANKFLVVANRDRFDGGGSFPRTVSMLMKNLPQASNRSEWAYLIIHELLHSWNGQSFRSAGQEHWFGEGFTDYLTYLLETRTGMVSEPQLFAVLARKYDEYLAVAGKVNLRAAGINKSKNYDLIYSGGLIVALALDIAILKSTNGARSLNDFMQQLYREFAVSGQRYELADLLRLANLTSGADLTAFFDDFITGTKVLALDSYLEQVGLGIRREEGKTTIIKLPNATAEQKRRLAKLLRRR